MEHISVRLPWDEGNQIGLVYLVVWLVKGFFSLRYKFIAAIHVQWGTEIYSTCLRYLRQKMIRDGIFQSSHLCLSHGLVLLKAVILFIQWTICQLTGHTILLWGVMPPGEVDILPRIKIWKFHTVSHRFKVLFMILFCIQVLEVFI